MPPLWVVSATLDMRRSWIADSTSWAVWECSQKAWMVMRGISRAPVATSATGSSTGSLSLRVRKLMDAGTPLSIQDEADGAAVAAAHAVGADAVHLLHMAEEDRLGVAGDHHAVGRQRRRRARIGEIGGDQDHQLGLA